MKASIATEPGSEELGHVSHLLLSIAAKRSRLNGPKTLDTLLKPFLERDHSMSKSAIWDSAFAIFLCRGYI